MYGLLPLVVLGAIVYGIVKLLGQRRPGTGTEDGFDVGRVFRYLLTFAALIVACIGLTELLGIGLSTADVERGSLAEPLAMTVVGLPAFVALAMWSWRVHGADAAERDSTGWSLYVNAALVTTLAVTVGNSFAVADRVIAGEWRGTAVAGLVVWAATWGAHWWAWHTLRPGMGPNVQLWLGSIIGLWVAAVSAAVTIAIVVDRIFAATTSATARGNGNDVTLAIAGVAIGAVVWWWHWLVHGFRTERSPGWHVYTLLFGVFASLIAAVSGAGYGLYLILEWLWGDPGTTSAVTQFRDLAAPIGAVVVGIAVWLYHRAVVGSGAAAYRTEVHRAYDYLVSAVALGTVAVALSILVVAFFSIFQTAAAGNGSGRNTLLAAVTLLVVGAPMWAITWRRVQALCARSDEEAGSPTRRRYLFAIFGIAGAVAFGSLISFLIEIFQAVLGEPIGGALIDDIDVPAALLVTTGAIAAYHWRVYRAERHLAVRVPTRDVLLVCDGVEAVDEIAARTHTRIRVLHRRDLPAAAAVDVEAIIRAIEASQGEHLLVLAGADDDIEVVPYE